MADECNKGFSCTEFYEAKLDALEKLFDLQLREIDNKTQLAKESMELRLASMNEFRETLRDQSSRLLSRDEYVADSKNVHNDLMAFRDFMVSMKAVASQRSMYVAVIVAVLSLLTSAGAVLLHIK